MNNSVEDIPDLMNIKWLLKRAYKAMNYKGNIGK